MIDSSVGTSNLSCFEFAICFDRLRSGPIGIGAVRPPCFGRKGSRLTALFARHPGGPRRAADLPSAPSQFGHYAGNLGRSRAVLFLWWIGKHSDLVVGKLVEIGIRFVAWSFRRHTLPVSHGCVSGSSVQNLKVAHYPKSRATGRNGILLMN